MRRILVLIPLALPLAACGGSGSGSNAAQTTTTSAAAPATASSAQIVMVSEKEFSITPASISLTKPGTYTFEATNTGTIGHALAIVGHGVDRKTGTIDPGKTATLRVDLAKTGSYQVFCPIDGHRNMGMKASLTVGGSAAPAMGTSTGGTTTGQTSTTKGGYGY